MSALATAGRRIRLRHRGRWISPRRMRLVLLGIVITALAGAGGWFLLKDSSFVAVEHVTITGVEGSDAAAIVASLDSAAHRMTTLDFHSARLRAAVSGFPEVKGLRVRTQFPHGIVIHVIELLPIAVAQAPGREVVVTGDGMLLPRVPVSAALPVIPLLAPPTGDTLAQAWARAVARLLAAAPARLLPRLAEATTLAGHGLVVQVRNGPSIYFGDATQARAKWGAAVAVLADPGSAGASYIDVTDPARPAAGTDAQVSQPSGASAAGSALQTPAAPTTSVAGPTLQTPATTSTSPGASTGG